MGARTRVAVLFGGRSGEHEVSLASAESVLANLDPKKYEVIPVGVAKDGRWLTAPDVLQQLRGDPGHQSEIMLAPIPGERRLLRLGERKGAGWAQDRIVDVVFPVLHGPYGEDGTVQGLLELADIPYVGSGVFASAASMDKEMAKRLWQAAGLPVVDWLAMPRSRYEADPEGTLGEAERAIGYPCFVKPSNLGSSVGVSKARSRPELRRGIEQAAPYDSMMLVERAVDARELECGVLGNDQPEASVVGEIIPVHEFYDYRAKYIDQGTELIIPAELPPELTESTRQMAAKAFTTLGCAGMARVDFFLERATNRLYVSEINTIPGFTSISMYPKLWEASGLGYTELLDRLIQLALERHADRARNRTSYSWE